MDIDKYSAILELSSKEKCPDALKKGFLISSFTLLELSFATLTSSLDQDTHEGCHITTYQDLQHRFLS